MVACSGKAAPTAPSASTPPAPLATWNLSGTVRSAAGGNVAAAMVAILDGPDAGKQATADTVGHYSFTGLAQAGFSLMASASGYASVTEGVPLTENRVVDFQLPRLPVAALSYESALSLTPRADGGYDLAGTVVNSGDACATAVSGVTTITGTSGVALDFHWALSPSTIIRPGERFVYRFGVSRDDAMRLGTGNGTYRTTFDFISGACP